MASQSASIVLIAIDFYINSYRTGYETEIQVITFNIDFRYIYMAGHDTNPSFD